MLMTALQWVNAAIVFLGIPTIAGVLILIGRKLEMLDGLKHELHNNIKPDLKDVRERFSALEGKTAGLFQAHSPISLTPKGKIALEESGLKAFIDDNKDDLFAACENKNGMKTPYDVQKAVIDYFNDYEFPEDAEQKIKTYAFNNGNTFESMRMVGALYFRDICLERRGFDINDLDK